jgi:two-component system nitrogen regulation response regulator NtrX
MAGRQRTERFSMEIQNDILIVDDDKAFGNAIKEILDSNGWNSLWVGSGERALKIIRERLFRVILLDLLLPGMDGLEVLRRLLRIDPNLIVVMISGHGSSHQVVEAIRLGAYDWLEKPLEKERILLTVRNALSRHQLVKQKDALLSDIESSCRMIGVSRAMQQICRLINRVAPQGTSVMITGETGVGKELVARAIHLKSSRAGFPFVRVNCAAVPETLIESELFGHMKGAYTGAVSDKMGKLQAANGGTLFLDEIGDLSLMAQAKVLRTLETGEVSRIGSEEGEKVDVRFIAATNKDLKDLMRQGSFRADLYHRINVIEFHVPPLRDRKEDIQPLMDHFLQSFAQEHNVSQRSLDANAKTILMAYEWPGNVRELRNLAERITVLMEGSQVSGAQVADLLRIPIGLMDFRSGRSLRQARESFERHFIIQALVKNKWNITHTARDLRIHRTLLYRKLVYYQIHSEELDKRD